MPHNNRIREIQSEIHAEYVKILAELTGLVKFEIKEIKRSEEILARIDFHFAKARYASKNSGRPEPEIQQEKFIEF